MYAFYWILVAGFDNWQSRQPGHVYGQSAFIARVQVLGNQNRQCKIHRERHEYDS
jgi:hypothetical protein